MTALIALTLMTTMAAMLHMTLTVQTVMATVFLPAITVVIIMSVAAGVCMVVAVLLLPLSTTVITLSLILRLPAAQPQIPKKVQQSYDLFAGTFTGNGKSVAAVFSSCSDVAVNNNQVVTRQHRKPQS